MPEMNRDIIPVKTSGPVRFSATYSYSLNAPAGEEIRPVDNPKQATAIAADGNITIEDGSPPHGTSVHQLGIGLDEDAQEVVRLAYRSLRVLLHGSEGNPKGLLISGGNAALTSAVFSLAARHNKMHQVHTVKCPEIYQTTAEAFADFSRAIIEGKEQSHEVLEAAFDTHFQEWLDVTKDINIPSKNFGSLGRGLKELARTHDAGGYIKSAMYGMVNDKRLRQIHSEEHRKLSVTALHLANDLLHNAGTEELQQTFEKYINEKPGTDVKKSLIRNLGEANLRHVGEAFAAAWGVAKRDGSVQEIETAFDSKFPERLKTAPAKQIGNMSAVDRYRGETGSQGRLGP